MIVTLAARTDFFPVPRVEITLEPLVVYDGGSAGDTGPGTLSGGSAGSTGPTVSGGTASTLNVDIPSGTDAVTLWWTRGVRRGRVSGVIGRFFTGAGGFQDLEAGTGEITSYELECFDGGVRLGVVQLGSVLLPHFGDPWDVLVQNPLDPSLNVIMKSVPANFPELASTADGSLVKTESASLPNLIGAGLRSGSIGSLSLEASTRAVAAKAWATLGTEQNPQVPVWLIRGVHPLLPSSFCCDGRTVKESSIDLELGGSRSLFTVDATEIARPAPALVKPSLRYSDLAAVFGTYSAIGAALPRYSEWSTAWEYAGAAGGS